MKKQIYDGCDEFYNFNIENYMESIGAESVLNNEIDSGIIIYLVDGVCARIHRTRHALTKPRNIFTKIKLIGEQSKIEKLERNIKEAAESFEKNKGLEVKL